MKEKAKNSNPIESFGFDLEERVKDKAEAKKLNDRIDSYVLGIKETQRQGQAKEEYSKLSTIMEGLIGLKKVVSQCQMRAVAHEKKRK